MMNEEKCSICGAELKWFHDKTILRADCGLEYSYANGDNGMLEDCGEAHRIALERGERIEELENTLREIQTGIQNQEVHLTGMEKSILKIARKAVNDG